MTDKIIALNQRFLNDPRLPVTADQRLDAEMLSYFCNQCHRDRVLQVGLMPRTGINNLPFDTSFVNTVGQAMPVYDPNFQLSWHEITDQRALQVQDLVENHNKKIYVQWSGGIDSTCIVVALLKNLDRACLDQVTICYTYDSVMEYHWFYEKHLIPNVRLQDLNQQTLDLQNTDNAILIDGQTADCLTMSMAPSLDVNMSVRNSQLLVESWRTRPDTLIDYLAKVTQSRDFAVWYYERVKQSVESVAVPIETYFDFMWWAGFNYDWVYQTFCQWFYIQRLPNFSWQEFSKKYMPWYTSADYQRWSMKNVGAWSKHGNTLSSFKRDAKKYCFDYTHDEWYSNYKTKVSSRGRPFKHDPGQPFAITDDFRVLDLTQDLPEILNLWHTHLKPSADSTRLS
jgi:hypothetical protein